MTLQSTNMGRLWKDSSPLHGRNHKSCLAEAMNAVRSTGEPKLAVELLRKIRRDVGSEQERKALDDVVGWLERRLRTEPSVTTTRLVLELGWLRRMAVVRAATHGEDDERRSGGATEARGHRNGPRRPRR